MSLFAELKRRNVIRVALAYAAMAWLLIQVAETIFPVFGFGDAPVRAVVIVAAMGFFPSMALAWVFELTPAGLRRNRRVQENAESSIRRGSKWLDRTILMVLTLGLGYFAVDRFLFSPPRETAVSAPFSAPTQQYRSEGREEPLVDADSQRSIAVLAFADMSQNGDQEYLSDGIAEELLNLLARIPELRVISRSSAFSYKGKQVKLEQIARELNVAHVLEGSVRQSGNRVRITAQLIDARSDTHLWSQTYDRTLEDIFAIQDEIAAAVVEQLKVTLLGGTPSVADANADPEAYALVLQARQLALRGTAEGYEQSIDLYRQALAVQPGYAVAWVGLATNYSNQANKSLRQPGEGYALAREAAQRALSVQPNYAPALAHLGWIAMIYDNDLPLAARYLERALALEPSNLAIVGNSATLLYTLGRLEASIALDEYVVAHDPVNPTGHANLAEGYLSVGRYRQSISSYEMALRLSPNRIATHYFMGVALLLNGQPEAALLAMQQEGFEVLRLLGLAMVRSAMGEVDASDALLAELIASYEQDAAYNIAYVLAYRGESDRAFEWLAKAVLYADPGLTDIVGEPLFKSLHADPRWLPFLESIGNAPGQLNAISFRVTHAPAGTTHGGWKPAPAPLY